MFSFFRKRRHAKIMAEPSPPSWAAILERNVPHTRLLSAAERARLEDLMQVFLAEKQFEGANGLEVTEEMRVSVAAQACMLLIGDPETAVYPDLGSVVLYPAPYVAKTLSHEGLLVAEKEQARLGESWGSGTVVLAWSAVKQGAANIEDGHNVVYHEFAHQLDQVWGPADGAPELPPGMPYKSWQEALSKEFYHLEERAEEGRPTLIDHYGATNAAEFFAVATETFFEKPIQMRERKPDLYAQLKGYYRQDPAERVIADRAARASEDTVTLPMRGKAKGKRAKK